MAAVQLPDEVADLLARQDLLDIGADWQVERLTGGVSGDIWRVGDGRRMVCAKRARPRLAVAEEWLAPVDRNRYERKYYQYVGGILPAAVPIVLAWDDSVPFFVMEYLPPDRHLLWKSELAAGRVDADFAARVGAGLAAIHGAGAGAEEVAREFDTGSLFAALRLDPYLGATGRRHRDLEPCLSALIDRTAAIRKALVHGDVSPKNILIGPSGPVFLDAECAWYGDPAFDLAFCLNHLLLKTLLVGAAAPDLLRSFAALWRAYRSGITWEAPEALEARAIPLTLALMLARIDGKSPVEYVTEPAARDRVRAFVRARLPAPPGTLITIAEHWMTP